VARALVRCSRSNRTASFKSTDCRAYHLGIPRGSPEFRGQFGTIDLNATYKFRSEMPVDLQATVSRIAVNDLAVRPKEADIDWITVPSLLLSGTTVDLLKTAGSHRFAVAHGREAGYVAGARRVAQSTQACTVSAGAGVNSSRCAAAHINRCAAVHSSPLRRRPLQPAVEIRLTRVDAAEARSRPRIAAPRRRRRFYWRRYP